DSSSYTRLHITPLEADLLEVLLSSALLPKARNISYHSIDTFPDRRYGFLDLPGEDAEKLRKKLNGAVVKGVKIRIERARPSRILVPLGNEAMADEKAANRAKDKGTADKLKPKKRKRGADEITGVVLEEGRQVKRGWTTPDQPKDKKDKRDKRDKKKEKKEKKRVKSKHTDHAECLVKTILPANASASPDFNDAVPRKKGKSREVVVHEFEKTAKFPSFLKAAVSSSPSGPPLEFVDRKGWVDEDGNVVETVKTRSAVAAGLRAQEQARNTPPRAGSADDEEANSSAEKAAEGSQSGSPVRSSRDTSPSRESPEQDVPVTSGETSSQPAQGDSKPVLSSLLANSDPSRPKSSSSAKSLSIKIPPATPKEPHVHPLEALYKRPKEADADTTANQGPSNPKPFSFFDASNDDQPREDVDMAPNSQVPMTPYSRLEFESRGVRSAAPTPDTAHPNQRFKPWATEDDDIEDDEDEGEDEMDEDLEDSSVDMLGKAPSQAPKPKDNGSASDFQKWFWENRGDLNRSWKKRRKLVGKEKRYRENKARMARAI
ncbi:hypothetical protein B0T26DRAFT_607173, partial [Lasiosphaeria miniovina]